jgi:hypothetical protein
MLSCCLPLSGGRGRREAAAFRSQVRAAGGGRRGSAQEIGGLVTGGGCDAAVGLGALGLGCAYTGLS